MIPDTTIAETLDALNAAEYTFFKAPTVPSDQGTTPAIWEPYVIPDSVIFDCKDGCLVAKESAAKTYAIANPYKRVYWLNQGEKSFSIKDYAVAIEIKNDTTWATPYSERKVNVLDGATDPLYSNGFRYRYNGRRCPIAICAYGCQPKGNR